MGDSWGRVGGSWDKALPHDAMKWAVFLRFCDSRSIAEHRRTSQVSPEKLQQCGQSTTNDGVCQHSPAILIAVMVIRNI